MIDKSLESGSFVLFKLPHTDTVEWWALDQHSVSDSKFIFHSFNNLEHLELYAQEKKTISLEDIYTLKLSLSLKDDDFPHVMSKEEYLSKAHNFIEKLKEGYLDKIILSRVKATSPIASVEKKLAELCKKYPTAWVYLFHHQNQTWLGASPERLLLSNEQEGYKTVALAATKSKLDHRDWTSKEYKEHNFVVEYITSKFKKDAVIKKGPYTIDLGDIQHLKTDIKIVDSTINLHQILDNLHPTPAVCGMPKDKAMQYILAHEDYDRSFYTGYFGIETPTHKEFNVNLRCARLFQSKTALYVGGGLVAESNAEAEWQETELKSKALF